MKLTPTLSLHRVTCRQTNIIEKQWDYLFRHKEFLAELVVGFKILAYTREHMMPVMNFGYALNLQQWNIRDQQFDWVFEHQENDGRSTKKYIEGLEDRHLIFHFVLKRLENFVRSYSPPLLVRGPLTQELIKLERYQEIDRLLQSYQYLKKEVACKDMEELNLAYSNKDRKENGFFWIYALKPTLLNEIKNLYISENNG